MPSLWVAAVDPTSVNEAEPAHQLVISSTECLTDTPVIDNNQSYQLSTICCFLLQNLCYTFPVFDGTLKTLICCEVSSLIFNRRIRKLLLAQIFFGKKFSCRTGLNPWTEVGLRISRHKVYIHTWGWVAVIGCSFHCCIIKKSIKHEIIHM